MAINSQIGNTWKNVNLKVKKKCNKSSCFDKYYEKHDSFGEENYNEFKDYLFENLFNDKDLNKDLDKDLFNDDLL